MILREKILYLKTLIEYKRTKVFIFKLTSWDSLVAQWIRICLPMQGTWVQSLVQGDPTCSCTTTINPVLQSPAATSTEAHTP